MESSQESGVSTIEEVLAANGVHYSTTVGDSMEPMLHNRSNVLVLVPPKGVLRRHDLPLYRRPDGKYVLHRILRVRAHDYIICGDNRYHREVVPHEWVIAVMRGYYKGERYIDAADAGYRRYVRFWCAAYPIRAVVLWCKWLPGRIRRKWRRTHGKTTKA